MVRGAAGVHEGLGDHAQARVHDVGLAQVEHEVGVLDQVNPEPGGRQFSFPGINSSIIRL